MPVRIYEISRRLGLDNKEVLAKAKELGLSGVRSASSTLDKITAEYFEAELRKSFADRIAARQLAEAEAAAKAAGASIPAPSETELRPQEPIAPVAPAAADDGSPRSTAGAEPEMATTVKMQEVVEAEPLAQAVLPEPELVEEVPPQPPIPTPAPGPTPSPATAPSVETDQLAPPPEPAVSEMPSPAQSISAEPVSTAPVPAAEPKEVAPRAPGDAAVSPPPTVQPPVPAQTAASGGPTECGQSVRHWTPQCLPNCGTLKWRCFTALGHGATASLPMRN